MCSSAGKTLSAGVDLPGFLAALEPPGSVGYTVVPFRKEPTDAGMNLSAGGLNPVYAIKVLVLNLGFYESSRLTFISRFPIGWQEIPFDSRVSAGTLKLEALRCGCH